LGDSSSVEVRILFPKRYLAGQQQCKLEEFGSRLSRVGAAVPVTLIFDSEHNSRETRGFMLQTFGQLGGDLGLRGGYAFLLFHFFQSASVASAIAFVVKMQFATDGYPPAL